MRIIYMDGGKLHVIIPTPEALEQFGIDAIARKDVPHGLAYKIIDEADLPDRAQRDKWTVDVRDLTDGVGSASRRVEDMPAKPEVERAISRTPGLVKVAK
jgi:hypothetical protein